MTIARIGGVELEAFRKLNDCGSKPQARVFGEADCRTLQKEQAAAAGIGIARDPQTVAVASDEEHRDRRVENARIGPA